MKICSVVHCYHPGIGGSEILMQNVSEQLKSQFQHDLQVVTSDCFNTEGFIDKNQKFIEQKKDVINGIPVSRFSTNQKAANFWQFFLNRSQQFGFPKSEWAKTYARGPISKEWLHYLSNTETDLFLAIAFPLLHMFYCQKVAKKRDLPYIMIGAIHPDDTEGYQRQIIFDCINNGSYYIALTEYEKIFLVENGVNPDKISVLGCGINLEDFKTYDQSQIRKKYQISPDDFVFGFMGQHGEHKGIGTFLQASLPVIKKRSDISIVIAGSQTNYTIELKKIVQSFPEKVKNKIHFISNFSFSQKGEILTLFDAMVSPSKAESFGITFLEAWFYQKPVVSTTAGAIPYVISDQKDGILISPDNTDELSYVMEELYENPSLCEKLGQAGRKKMLERYTWEKIASDLNQIIAKQIR